MNNVNVNKEHNIKLIKNFIQDLSFENPHNLNYDNSENNNKIDFNTSVIFKPYDNNYFSLILKYNLDCSSKVNGRKLFNLELDYFGYFKILVNKNYDQKSLAEQGTKLLFPYVKEIIEDITRKGGSIPILLNDIDFNLK